MHLLGAWILTHLNETIILLQLRRQARLRREYLYRKSLEDKERSILERKRKLRDAVEGRISNFAAVLIFCMCVY